MRGGAVQTRPAGLKGLADRRLDRLAKSSENVKHRHAFFDAPNVQKGVKLCRLVQQLKRALRLAGKIVKRS